MSSPVVSVILPVFNGEDYVSQAIFSVLEQTFKEFELIVVDDGSSDGSLEIVKNFNDERIKIVTQENGGLANARNSGINKASGKWIAFIDADDEWLPSKLEKQVEFLKANQDHKIVHTNYVEFDESGEWVPKPTKHFKHFEIHGDLYETLLVFNPVAVITVMMERELMNKIANFDNQLRSCEDWDCWIRISKKTKFGYLPEVLARYRINPKGLSKNYGSYEEYYFQVLKNHTLIKSIPENTQKKSLWFYHRHMAHGFARNRNFKKSVEHLLGAWKTSLNIFANSASVAYVFLQFLKPR